MAQVVFFGTPEFALPILDALIRDHTVLAVVTQPDSKAGRGRKRLSAPPVKELAQAHGIEVLQPRRLRRSHEALDHLSGLNADVFVLAAYGQILPASVLKLTPHGCIGVHASLLPSLRGAAPVAAAILQGLDETGITLMLTDEGMDTGDIISQARLPILPDDTTETLTERLARLGADLLTRTLPAWLAGEIEPTPQDDSQATLAPLISRDDAAIDWSASATAIDRLVRAYFPWPGAYTTVEGKTLKLLSAALAASEHSAAEPGTVILLPGGIGVVTGCGVLRLGTIQLAGKRAMDAGELARGYRGLVGARLGSTS